MDIQTRKIEFIQAFLKLENTETIAFFEKILQSKTKNRFQPMSTDELNKRIDQSEMDFENGKFKSHEEVFAKYQ